MYGPRGAGVAEHLDYDAHVKAGNSGDAIKGSAMDRCDIITGMLSHLPMKNKHLIAFAQALLERLTALSAGTLLDPRT